MFMCVHVYIYAHVHMLIHVCTCVYLSLGGILAEHLTTHLRKLG